MVVDRDHRHSGGVMVVEYQRTGHGRFRGTPRLFDRSIEIGLELLDLGPLFTQTALGSGRSTV